MQHTVKPATDRWSSFVSLEWYDGVISFLFRFVAKTSEPLLAAGVIVSAADFLQKGALMAHNPTLSTAWAWTQALAIEASTGPVLVFALQAFRARDMVKGWLYAILAALLFIVGGAMLLLQLVSSVTGLSEASINIIVLYVLFVLRVIVSGGMVALSCTKHLRFSGLFADEQANPVPAPPLASALTDETVQLILSKLAKLDALEQAIATHQVTVTSVEEPLAQLPAPSETAMDTAERREQASVTRVPERETEPPVHPLRVLLPSVSGIASDDIAKVIGAHLQGIPRREICAHLRWGSSKYSSIVKPVLDVWEQSRNTETETVA